MNKNISEKYEKYIEMSHSGYTPSMTLQQEQINDRVLFLNSPVNGQSAEYIINGLKYLNKLNPNKPIQLLINSPGGSIIDGIAILETMFSITAPVYTIAIGMAASMASVILAAGEPGHRLATPLSTVMIHEGSTGTEGTMSNAKASIEFSQELLLKMTAFLAASTGKTIKQIQEDGVIDKYMTAEEAKEYGLIDAVFEPANEGKKKQLDKVLKMIEKERERLKKEQIKKLSK